MDDQNERIRQRAHEIWEEEGRPEGREYSHWLRARADVGPDMPADEKSEWAARADIARNALPPGTVPENPTAENPGRIARLKLVPAKKPLDARDIDTRHDKPL